MSKYLALAGVGICVHTSIQASTKYTAVYTPLLVSGYYVYVARAHKPPASEQMETLYLQRSYPCLVTN